MCVDVCPAAVLVIEEASLKATVKTAGDGIACLSCASLRPPAPTRRGRRSGTFPGT